MKRIATRIATLKSSEQVYLVLISEANAAALAATSQSGYERASTQANALEAIVLRLSAERQALEVKLSRHLPVAA